MQKAGADPKPDSVDKDFFQRLRRETERQISEYVYQVPAGAIGTPLPSDEIRDSLSLTFRSENQGCGCCVNMWNVEGPDEALAALPLTIKATGRQRVGTARCSQALISLSTVETSPLHSSSRWTL